MSDQAEYWKAIREQQQQDRAERREEGVAAIARLATLGFRVEAITPYQFRINGSLDVYPTNRRFHCLTDGERGTYQEVALLVIAHFGE